MTNQIRTLRYSENRREGSGSEHGFECLHDDDILAFAEGRMDSADMGRVHLHADRCELCQQLLNHAARALAPSGGSGHHRRAFSAMLHPEELVSERYRIVRFLASGGMGEVYEAFDLELHARIALKTVKSTACDDPAAVRRLKIEVQLAHRVSHPNVCRIFDFGTHESERDRAVIHYLTMEFVDGRNLGELLRAEGAMAIETAVAIGRELLLGLRAAHGAGVLHRDFKSDNVMVRRRPDGALGAVILDFGLARGLDANRESNATTRGSALLGTLKYMAPEQIEGKTLSTRADVYAFGMVLFEMLAGDVAFPAATEPANALFERLRRPAPSPREINRKVSAPLDALVRRCLARNPDERYASAAEVLSALDALVRRGMHRPVESAPSRSYGFWVSCVVGLCSLALHGEVVRPASPSRTVHAASAPLRVEAGGAGIPPLEPALTSPPGLLSRTGSTTAATLKPERRRHFTQVRAPLVPERPARLAVLTASSSHAPSVLVKGPSDGPELGPEANTAGSALGAGSSEHVPVSTGLLSIPLPEPDAEQARVPARPMKPEWENPFEPTPAGPRPEAR